MYKQHAQYNWEYTEWICCFSIAMFTSHLSYISSLYLKNDMQGRVQFTKIYIMNIIAPIPYF